VKRSGRDESIRVVIHFYMEAMLGISLYSYSYLKLAKTLCLCYYLSCFLSNKIGEEGRTGSAWKQERERGEREEAGSRQERGPKQCIHIRMNE
jgi:hypothetical protein